MGNESTTTGEKSLLELLDIDGDYSPDADAPPIDQALLERYADNQASKEEAALVRKLTSEFECWRDQVGVALTEHGRRRQGEANSSSD